MTTRIETPVYEFTCCNRISSRIGFFLQMNKRSLNETAFSVQGVNPGLSARDEPNASQAQQSSGKVVLKRFVYHYY